LVTSGAIGLVWGFVKNVFGQLQTPRKLVLQAIGCLAYTLIDAIQWVSYGNWLSQPEGAKHVSLVAYPEKWLVL